MNSTAKIKAGYKNIIEGGEAPRDVASPVMYNVPNPPSDVDADVDVATVEAAIKTHCKTSLEQFNQLPEEVRAKLVRR